MNFLAKSIVSLIFNLIVNVGDFKYNYVENIKVVKEGDRCPYCNGSLYFKKGIEIGNIFKIGTKYSEALNLQYLDEYNKLNPVVMGCYGIGVGRIMAAIAEQKIDNDKIIWPKEIAPFEVAIVPISSKDDSQMYLANKIYEDLKNNNVDVVVDDRDERPGVKFNDIEEGIVEFLYNNNNIEIKYDDVINKIHELFGN